MSKPLGMTPFFQIVVPDDTQNAIYKAVEMAIENGVSVEQFRREARECWEVVTRQNREWELQEWDR